MGHVLWRGHLAPWGGHTAYNNLADRALCPGTGGVRPLGAPPPPSRQPDRHQVAEDPPADHDPEGPRRFHDQVRGAGPPFLRDHDPRELALDARAVRPRRRVVWGEAVGHHGTTIATATARVSRISDMF